VSGRCEASLPVLRFATEAERVALKEPGWWSITEIEQTAEVVFPSGLEDLIRNCALWSRT
jgi:hypothetical protein